MLVVLFVDALGIVIVSVDGALLKRQDRLLSINILCCSILATLHKFKSSKKLRRLTLTNTDTARQSPAWTTC